MWISPSFLTFYRSLLLRIILLLSSPSLLLAWLALELNTLAFIPLILQFKTPSKSEARIKYFLTQRLASILFLIFIPLFFFKQYYIIFILLLTSLALKTASAPFHSWIPSVSKTLNWDCLFTLLTIQKINPLIILLSFSHLTLIILTLSIFSLIIGSLFGLTQTHLTTLLAYSSINHIGWILISTRRASLLIIYFLVYCLTLLPLTLSFNSFNIKSLNQITHFNLPPFKKLYLSFILLSLGGLPPFLGFLPKWLVLQYSLQVGLILLTIFIILIRLVTLFFYLRISFRAIILNSLTWYKIYPSTPTSFVSNLFLFSSLSGLCLAFLN